MIEDNAKRIVAGIIKVLDKRKVKLQKVLLHKFIYFLSTQGVVKEFKFEPYTYGPYSFDLASTLRSLSFWDAINESKSYVEIVDLDKYSDLADCQSKQIEKSLIDFENIVGEFTFDRLECVGTVLYCAQALDFQNFEVTRDTVLKEFKQWKGNRYPDSQILNDFEKLKPFISIQ